MIKVFQATDTNFTSNGDKIIKPYKAIVFKEDNGDYYCDLEASIDLMDYLKQDMIVCVKTPWGWQPFRCDKPERSGNKVKVRAWHIYYDTENYVIEDTYVSDSGCNAALNKLKGGCDSTLPFSVISDITDTGSFRCIRKTFAEAVNHVLEVWGGHLDRDGWNIGIRANIGQDRGVTLAYGKNIKEITAVENWDNVCTKILPVGYDGVTLDFIVSSTQYDIPYTRIVEFSQDLERQEGESDEAFTARLKADLQIQATKYLADHALPEVNYTLKAHLQDVADVGDTIWVKHPKCKVDVETHVISVKWDAIKGEYKEIEFGNFRQKLSGLNGMVTAEIKKAEKNTESFVNEELRKATEQIMGVLGNSYVIYDGDKILIVDKLPKEEAKNVIRINSAGIGFSQNGINGTFNSAWLIDGTFDAQNINVINLSADSITSGTLDAERVGAGSFDITGGSIKIASKTAESFITLAKVDDQKNELESLRVSAEGITLLKANLPSLDDVRSIIKADSVKSPMISGDALYIQDMNIEDLFSYNDHTHPDYSRTGHTHSSLYSGAYRVLLASNFLRPDMDDTYVLGGSGYRWKVVYSVQGTSSSSDMRMKNSFDTNMEKYVKMLDLLEPTTYLFNNDEDGSRHVGYIAQKVWKAMKDVGLEEKDFGGFDRFMQEEGSVYTYGLRYTQFIPILHAKIKQLEQRIEEKEQQIKLLNDRIDMIVSLNSLKECIEEAGAGQNKEGE